MIIKKTLIKTILFTFLLNTFIYGTSAQSTKYTNNDVQEITRYSISIPNTIANLPKSIKPGIGSSITFKKCTSTGTLLFYCLPDRGPNFQELHTLEGQTPLIYPFVDFTPFVGILEVKPQYSATLIDHITLRANGHTMSGLPTPEHLKSVNEIPVTMDFTLVQPNPNGLDPEGLDLDKDGNIWISDEYGPSISKFDGKSGNRLATFSPGKGLPEILNQKQLNRGFESIAVTPSGKVLAAMESTLDINKETKNSARFIRFVLLDPKSGESQILAYSYDQNVYLKSSNAKIGDIAAIDDTHFLIIEQGKISNDKMRHLIYTIDISRASDITNKKLANGKDLEYATARDLKNINFIDKAPLLHLEDYGWEHEKMEGLAIIDANTIALINDSDFGIKEKISQLKDAKYEIDLKNKTFLRNGQPFSAKPDIEFQENWYTELWIIKLNKNLIDYIPKV